VRVNVLLCLGDLIPKLDKQATLEILQTIQRCAAVVLLLTLTCSAPMLMCALRVANSMLKQVRFCICSFVQNARLQILVLLGTIVVLTIK